MMRKNYYLILAALGLFLMIPVAFVLGGRGMMLLFLSYLPQIATGCAWALFIGYRLDRLFLGKTQSLAFTIVSSTCIFASGALIGSTANVLLSSRIFDSPVGIGNEVFDWFVKPIYWLYVIGIPCSLLVGAVYYGIFRLIGGNKKSPH